MIKFPCTPSIAWGSTIEPSFRTLQQKSETGQRKTIRKWIYPEYRLTCSFNVLTQDKDKVFNDLNTVMGFFLEMEGSNGVFLWRDDNFNHVDNMLIGTGDGDKTTFQLKRQIGNFIEPVLDVEDLVIHDCDIPHHVNDLGQVVFGYPPDKGKMIYATYDYFWRVAFASDKLTFNNFYKRLWSLKKMELVTVK